VQLITELRPFLFIHEALMMNSPLIGISTGSGQNAYGDPVYSVPATYPQAVIRAGGTPILIPKGLDPASQFALLGHLQGLILTGGPDIDPALFGGAPHPKVYGVDLERDNQEIHLVREACGRGLPFLGICRGIQVIDVALGGTLYTDIQDQLPGALRHENENGEPRDRIAHTVDILPGTLLADVISAGELPVNSLHHQGVLAVAPGLVVSAVAPDGLVEAVELQGHPFGLGLQWHPEWMPADPQEQKIFTRFIQAARKAGAA
jgi:putative glutamine amidotransferase